MHPTPHHWKDARRLHAWHLKPQGWPQRQMAEALGVSAGAVSQWMARARDVGPEARRRRPPPGAPRRLSPAPLARLPELLPRGPPASGCRGDLWTRSRVAAMLRVAFGVSSHPRPVGRLLDVLRWSPQKPVRRARQRHEAAMAPWRDDTWPAITKGRKSSRKRSSSSTSPGFTRGPVSGAPMLPSARRRCCGHGLPVISCRRSAPSRPRASSPARRRITR